MRSRLLLALVSVVFYLIAAELVLRALHFGRPLIHQTDPVLLWRLAPNQRAYSHFYRMPITIDSHGLRDDEFPLAKEDGEFRILVLGDSVIFGQGVPSEDLLVQRLERALQASRAFPRVQVIDSGVSGWGPQQERIFLEREGLAFAPDVVILGFCHNDVMNAHDWPRLQANPPGWNSPNGVDLRKVSAIYHGLSIVFSRFGDHSDKDMLRPIPTEPDEVSWNETVAELRALARSLETAAVPFVLIVFPTETEVETATPRDISRLTEFAREESVFLLDLYPHFAAHRTERLFVDPAHPNARANEIAAEIVERFLVDHSLLTRKDAPEAHRLSRMPPDGQPNGKAVAVQGRSE